MNVSNKKENLKKEKTKRIIFPKLPLKPLHLFHPRKKTEEKISNSEAEGKVFCFISSICSLFSVMYYRQINEMILIEIKTNQPEFQN